MKKMRILAALLAATLVLVLTACNGTDNETDTTPAGSGAMGNPNSINDNADVDDDSNDEADDNTDNSNNGRGGNNTNPNANNARSGNTGGNNENHPTDADGNPVLATLGNNAVTQWEMSGTIQDIWAPLSDDPNAPVPQMNVVLGAYLARIVTYDPATGHPVLGNSTFQSFGFPGIDDGRTLLSLGTPVIAIRDENGHGDTSRVVNGQPFFGKREITAGYMVATVTTELHGGVQVHYNIAIYAPKGAVIDGCAGTWNLREKHLLMDGHPFTRHNGAQFLELEARYGAKHPAVFAGYEASEGEVIDLFALHAKLVAEDAYFSYNTSLPNWS